MTDKEKTPENNWGAEYEEQAKREQAAGDWAEQYIPRKATPLENFQRYGVPTGDDPYIPAIEKERFAVPEKPDLGIGNIPNPIESGGALVKSLVDDPALPLKFGKGVWDVAASGLAGAAEGVQNTMSTGLLAADTAISAVTKPVFGQESHMSKLYDENRYHPKPVAQGFLNELGFKTGELGPGMILGDKGVTPFLKEASGLMSYLLNLGIRGAGQTAGGAVLSQNPDDEKVLMKDGPIGKIPFTDTELPGLGSRVDPNASYNTQQWQKKWDLLGEGLIMGGVFGAAATPLGAGLRYVSSVVRKATTQWQSVPAQEKKIVLDLLHVFADIKDTDSPQIIREKMNRAVSYIEKNRETLIKFSDLDSGVDNEKYINDTITALAKELDPEMDGALLTGLESLRQSSISGKSPQLLDVMDAPARSLQRSLDNIADSRGDSENIPAARDTAITAKTEKEIVPIQQELARSQDDLVKATQKTEQLLARDPTFGPLIQKLGNDVNIDFSGATVKQADTITNKLRDIWRDMTTKKNDLYKSIGNAPIDRDGLDQFLAVHGENIPQDILSRLQMKDLDFQSLNQELGPRIGATIKGLKSDPAKNFGTIDALSRLQKHIDEDQLDFLASSGAEDVAERAKIAKDYFINQYKPYWRDGRLEDIANDFQDLNRPLTSQASARNTVTSTLIDPKNPDLSGQMVDVIERNIGKEGTKEINDFALLNIAQDVQKFVNAKGKLSPEDAERFASTLDRVVPILQKTNPEQVPQLNNMLTNLRNNRFDTNELQDTIDRLSKDLKDKEEEIYGTFFKEFFGGKSGAREKLPDSFKSMQELFNKDQNSDRIAEIKELVKDNPIAKQGFEAAYIKNLKKNLEASGQTPGRLRQSNLAGLEDLLDPDSSTVKYGKEIFGDEYMTLIQKLANNVYDIEAPMNARRGAGLNTKQFGEEASKSADSIITWIFGVLDPTAARIRTIKKDLGKAYDPEDQVKRILDTVLSNPDEFTRIAKEVLKNPIITTEQKRMMRKALIRGGLYAGEDTDEQTEEVFRE